MSEPDIEIRIRTSADLRAATQLKRALEDQIAVAKKMGQDSSILEKRLAAVNAQINAAPKGGGMLGQLNQQLSQAIPGFGRLSALVTTLTTGPLAALTLAITAVVGALKAASAGIREFAEAQQATTKLDVALAQTGQLTEAYRQKLHALAAQLQETTGIADEEWLGVLKRLTQFGSTEKTIERDIEAVKNLAGILEGDLATAAMIVSKAMRGSFETLSRYGILVDDHASDAENLTNVYEQLALRGAGQLTVATKTLTGQFRILQSTTSDFFENLGGLIYRTGIVQKAIEAAGSRLKFYGDIMQRTIPIAEGLTNATRKTTQQTDEGAGSSKRYTEELAKLKAQADNARKSFDDLSAAVGKHKRQTDEIADAHMAVDLARVDAAEQAGLATPEDAIVQRADIRQRHKKEAFQRDQQFREFEIANNKKKVAAEYARIRSIDDEISRIDPAAQPELFKQKNAEKDRLASEFPELARDVAAKNRGIRQDQSTAQTKFILETESGLISTVSSASSARSRTQAEADPSGALKDLNKAATQNGKLSLELLQQLLAEIEAQNHRMLQLRSRADALRTK